MAAEAPDTSGHREIRELCRALLKITYPEKNADWIDREVAAAEKRITLGGQYPDLGDEEPPSESVINLAAPVHGDGLPRPLRLPAVLLGVVLAVAAVMLADSVAAPAVGTGVVVGLVGLALLCLGAAVVTHVRARREMILSCRVLIDAPFTTDRGESLLMQGGDTAVPDPGVVVVRVKNTGGVVIEARDYLLPLTLRFPGRRIDDVDVTESEPRKLQELVPKTPGFDMAGDQITLPKISLARDSSYKLLVKLSGTRSDSKAPEVEGHLRGGRITTEPTERSTGRDTLVWGGLTACFAAALVVVMLFTDVSPFIQRPAGLTCVADELTVAGSTAFGRAAIEVAGSYRAYCSSSAVTVRTPGSKAGADELRAATGDRFRRLALSDGKDTGSTTGLTATKLAVVPFTLVAHKDVPVDTLSLEDVKRIFNGEADTWGKITHDKNDIRPIRIAGRTLGSGTRRTLNNYVLGLSPDAANPNVCNFDSDRTDTSCGFASTEELLRQVADKRNAIGYADLYDAEQLDGQLKLIRIDNRKPTLDAIRDGYPFWAVEYLYSADNLPKDSLAVAFSTYLRSNEGGKTMSRLDYIPCTEVNDLCNQR